MTEILALKVYSSAVGCEVFGDDCMAFWRCARFTSAIVVTPASSSSLQRWWLFLAWVTSSGMSMNAGTEKLYFKINFIIINIIKVKNNIKVSIRKNLPTYHQIICGDKLTVVTLTISSWAFVVYIRTLIVSIPQFFSTSTNNISLLLQ